MKSNCTVLIAEDHALVRKGLRSLLSSMESFDVVGEAAGGLEAVKLVQQLKPDLLLLDLAMPDLGGLDAIRQIKHDGVMTKILVLTMHGSPDYLIQAFKAGADGYLLKGADPEELHMAIKVVMAGRAYISSEISGQVIQGYLSGSPETRTPIDDLTVREREILKLVAEGHTNKEIGALLFISPRTVDKHRSNLMRKLDRHTARELTDFAKKHGLVNQ
ncbi:MAG: response regulator transcription factor [Deltaproteobacteria bacterium]|nr:response regulator transcription factor [Deltaproteobacteria bacterium]